MFKPKMFLFPFFLVFLLLFYPVFAQEALTITTYYPSPYGSYDSLQTNKFGVGDNNNDGNLTSADIPTTDGDVWIEGRVGIGTINPGARLHVAGDARVDGYFNYQQRNCYRITYTVTGNVMCNVGYYVAGIWDDGVGMPGPNGLVCCR
ncbi:MAG: hypothetical protein ABIG31_02945 [Candidatus Omnitrophota bacterium]